MISLVIRVSNFCFFFDFFALSFPCVLHTWMGRRSRLTTVLTYPPYHWPGFPLSPSFYTCVVCLLFRNGQFGWFREGGEKFCVQKTVHFLYFLSEYWFLQSSGWQWTIFPSSTFVESVCQYKHCYCLSSSHLESPELSLESTGIPVSFRKV